MRTHHQLHRLLAVCGVTALLLAGCSGEAVAPTAAERPSATLGSAGYTTTIQYDPRVASTFYLGGQHKISFAANAVCDPQLSTYGVTEWDKPCTPLAAPVTITAVAYTDSLGRPHVDFSPSLRFVPGSDVVLYVRDKESGSGSGAVIQWCETPESCVTEPASLPAYETKQDAARGVYFRNIKHFSGYTITAGRNTRSGAL